MGKGISTLLGTIILIGIAIGAGTSIFNIVNQYAIVGFTKNEYAVMDASLTKDSNGKCFLYIKLLNSGTESLSDTNVEVSTDRPVGQTTDGFPVQVSTDDRTFDIEVIITESATGVRIDKFSIAEKATVDPGQMIEFDSLVFTNMTGQLTSVNPPENLTKLQDFFNNCKAWNSCLDYTMDIHGKNNESESSTSSSLKCEEIGRI